MVKKIKFIEDAVGMRFETVYKRPDRFVFVFEDLEKGGVVHLHVRKLDELWYRLLSECRVVGSIEGNCVFGHTYYHVYNTNGRKILHFILPDTK